MRRTTWWSPTVRQARPSRCRSARRATRAASTSSGAPPRRRSSPPPPAIRFQPRPQPSATPGSARATRSPSSPTARPYGTSSRLSHSTDEASTIMDDLLQLQQPLKDGGIRSVNFFNGRLLAGKDLSREQAARRESDWRLGLALGNGVAFGFKVDEDSQSTSNVPIVRVQAGLAVNPLAQALRLTRNNP